MSPSLTQAQIRTLIDNCEAFCRGTKKLYESGPNKGDMWFFELWHHLRACADALSILTKQKMPTDKARAALTSYLVSRSKQKDKPHA